MSCCENGELVKEKQVEHRKFYYKGENVILTCKAGNSILYDAVKLLEKNFIGLPVIQTFHAVGDSKRPQHKTILVGEHKVIITGKKSSGLVGQVYEMLNRYLDLLCESLVSGEPADKSSFAPEVSEQKSAPLAIPDKNTSNPPVVAQTIIVKPTAPVPTPNKDQKKHQSSYASKNLFSKAITAIHSQSRSRSVSSPSSSISATPALVTPAPDAQISALATSTSDPAKPAAPASAVSTVPVDNRVRNRLQFRLPPPAPFVPRSAQLDINHNIIVSDSPASGYLCQGSNDGSGVCQPEVLLIEDCSVESNTSTTDTSAATVKQETLLTIHENANETETVPSFRRSSFSYTREELLSFSLSLTCRLFPKHLFVDEDHSICISDTSKENMFDPSKHRLPHADFALSSVFVPPHSAPMPSANIGTGRRNFTDHHSAVNSRTRPQSTSDPRSWGDNSGTKRGRKPYSTTGGGEVLYSESAYNCMENVPPSATYCTDFDEVFRNEANVVPGVAFTKRPRESQDSKYVQELLQYYESHGN